MCVFVCAIATAAASVLALVALASKLLLFTKQSLLFRLLRAGFLRCAARAAHSHFACSGAWCVFVCLRVCLCAFLHILCERLSVRKKLFFAVCFVCLLNARTQTQRTN